jgi:uncharacterized repeat protein (TIGR03806 family)
MNPLHRRFSVPFLVATCVAAITFFYPTISHAADYGLDAPKAIGAYLDGKFPPQAPGASGGWVVQRVYPNIAANLPTFCGVYPGTNKLLIVEKDGRILKFENNQASNTTEVFLDIRSRVYSNSDSGMTYFAFHPEFGQPGSPNRGYVYITYKYSPSGDSGDYGYWRLSRFTVHDGQTVADPDSEQILISQFDLQQWHDSGCLLFGTDGFLYVGIGDEGGANDQYNDTQKINDRLFSGVLRIDVNQDETKSHPIRRHPLHRAEMPAGWPESLTQNYYIPNDNPFVNPDGSVLEEFYALGFRNPYRFNMDPETGKIWVGDVGQDTQEEVDLLEAGANYGWAIREGAGAGPKVGTPPATVNGTLTEPKWSYLRNLGSCVVSGYFYHGSEHPALTGKLLVVDNTSGRIWALTKGDNDTMTAEYLCSMPSGAVYSGTVSCVQDQNGEVYFLKLGDAFSGEFYKLARTGAAIPEPPALISQLGAFTNLASLTPRAGLIPYTVNAALWSDAALKRRWIAVPNDGTHNTAAEKIKFAPEGEWTFPAGTVFVKHFELATDENNPASVRKLETRFLIISATGEPYGVTYRWRPDGSDADLLTTDAEDTVSIALAAGGTRNQTWRYPSRSDCMICHNSNAKYVLGVKTWQLNGNQLYPETGRTANQLATLGHLGMFDDAYHEEHIPYFLKAKNISDISAPLETRVRSYIDANCSQCHRPNGVRANFDARFTTAIENQHIIRGKIEDGFTGQPESVIQPGDAAHSVMFLRASLVGTKQMPPLARSIVDTTAVTQIQNWINSLGQGPAVSLSKAGNESNGDYLVNVEFSNSVSGLTTSDFRVRYGSVVSLTGSGAAYVLRIAPKAGSTHAVLVDLPAGAASANELPSYASNRLTIEKTDASLVTWLKLDETSGLIAHDSSTGGNDATIDSAEAASWVTGKIGGALEFNTDGQRMTMVNKLTHDFTLSFWMKSTQRFLRNAAPYDGSPLFFADAGGKQADVMVTGTRRNGVNVITFMTDSLTEDTASLYGETEVCTGDWVHVAVCRKQSTGLMQIFVNGVLDVSMNGSTATLDANMVLETGHANAENTDYAGSLDQVKIYDHVLTQAEITALSTETPATNTGAIDAWYAANLPGLTHLQDFDIDPDGDGLSNLAEFAVGGNPLSDTVSPIEINPATSNAVVRYLNRKVPGGLIYAVQMSADQSTWQAATGRLNNLQNANATDAAFQWTSGTFTPGGAENKMFFRLNVSGDPE